MTQKKEKITVPDLKGKNLRWSRFVLEEMNLIPGIITYKEKRGKQNIILTQDPAPGTPLNQGQEVNLTVSAESPVRRLPEIFQKSQKRGDNFLKRFLWIAHSLLNEIDLCYDHLAELLNPLKTDRPKLEWLRLWFPLTLLEEAPVNRQRMLIREAVSLYRWRGTAPGLTKMLEILTGVKPEIYNGIIPPHSFALSPLSGKENNLILDEYTAGYKFSVYFPCEPDFFGSSLIRRIHRIIKNEKPAFCDYFVMFAPSGKKNLRDFQIDNNTVIDEDTTI